jgi:hypothetical protein
MKMQCRPERQPATVVQIAMYAMALLIFFAAILGCMLADNAELQTWGHVNAELNDSTAVAPANVRRSTVYDVQVATTASPQTLHDSFTYMSLPRSGRAKADYTDDDGAEFAAQAKMTMSWTTFLYRADAWVYVSIKQAPALNSADEVTIRPTTLRFQKELVNPTTVRILVPYSGLGYRFSVEFDSQQVTSYGDESGGLTTDATDRPAVHTEPRNAMMIFAEPILTGDSVDQLVPSPASHSIYYPDEGNVSNLDEVTQEVIYFRPGTYYMNWNYQAALRPKVRWVYLAPGAYVKGAFQFRTAPADLKVTGLGVLSGEQYVYEPDRINGYNHRASDTLNCHSTCVKMLEFGSAVGEHQHLTMYGVTVANPPYNSFVVYGDVQNFRADATHIKQVGGWYWQSDGPELYQRSSVQHSFFHSNDDVLKLYGSRVDVNDIVVWKSENGPVIQWGWAPRNIDNVHVNGVDVIHNRMYRDSHNACIVNSAKHYLDPNSSNLAHPQTHVTNVFLENIRSEGKNLCAMRLYALSSWENIHIENLWIEEWNGLDKKTQASRFEALSNENGERVFIGNEVVGRRGLAIVNYVVGAEHVSRSADNWRSDQTGRLDFDASLWDNWDAR